MVRRSKTENTAVPRIYREEVANLQSQNKIHVSEISSQIPALLSKKSTLCRNRRETMPKLPKNRFDIQLKEPYTKTLRQEPFLLADTQNKDRILYLPPIWAWRYCQSMSIGTPTVHLNQVQKFTIKM